MCRSYVWTNFETFFRLNSGNENISLTFETLIRTRRWFLWNWILTLCLPRLVSLDLEQLGFTNRLIVQKTTDHKIFIYAIIYILNQPLKHTRLTYWKHTTGVLRYLHSLMCTKADEASKCFNSATVKLLCTVLPERNYCCISTDSQSTQHSLRKIDINSVDVNRWHMLHKKTVYITESFLPLMHYFLSKRLCRAETRANPC